MEEIQLALELKAQLDALRPIDIAQEGRIMQKFRLDWNYHSNHLEGNTLTYGETKALILHGITAQGKPLKDTLEITGHNEAINWVLDMVNGERSLTENFIRELHALLLKEPYEVDALTPEGKPTKKKINVGSYKSTPNHVLTKTGEMFYFASPEETPAKMHDLLHWFNEKSKEDQVNPIFLAAEFHYKFIRIHPFDDGNGRTARILMNFILMQFGFPPTIIKSDTDSKNEYFAALQLADVGNIEAFIIYIAQNLNRSLQIMIAGAKGEEIEEDDDLDKEIKLLEQKVNSLGKTIENKKTKEALLNIYDDSLRRLYERFKLGSEKFEKFYTKNNFFLIINEGKFKHDDFFRLRSMISVNTIQIAFVSHHNTFNKENMGEFDYKGSSITINFGLNKYRLFSNDISFFEKKYSQQLTDKEIDKIVNILSKKHIKFIEQKIAEKENK